jgi:uncharacterized repeat protein (TIGR01451 family)
VELQDTLPDYVVFGTASASQGTCTHSATEELADGGIVNCNLGRMIAGSQVTVTINVTPRPPAIGKLTNTASVQAHEQDGNPANNEVQVSSVVEEYRGLSLNKSAAPDTPSLKQPFTYTLTLLNCNSENDPLATNVVVTDTLPAGLDFVAVQTDRGTCEEQDRMVRCAIGTLGTCGHITQTAQIAIQVVPNFAIDVVNTAWASSDQTEKPGISDTYTVTVDGPKALMIAPGTLAITVTGNTSMTLDILSQVRHREGQSVHITDASEPAHGTVTINDDGTVTYTPDEGYVGSDSFEVTVTDEDGNSTRVRVEVEVVGQTTGMHWVYLATVLK